MPTSNWSIVIELSVYMTNLLACSGIVPFSLEATYMHVAPRSCSCVFNMLSIDRNRSKKFIDSRKTSSSHFCSSHTCKQTNETYFLMFAFHNIKHRTTRDGKIRLVNSRRQEHLYNVSHQSGDYMKPTIFLLSR